jgi:hypothetical protein
MDMVHLPGKGTSGGRRVPILLAPEIVLGMEVLAKHRVDCGIPASNKFFFATPSVNGYLNGWQAMHNVSVAAELKQPERIHSTILRK